MIASLHTIGQLADMNDVAIHRIEYIVKARNIPHVARAGHYRLFDDAAAARVARELEKVGAERKT